VHLDSDEIREIFERLPLSKIPFIGKKLETRISRTIETIEDFRRAKFSYFQRIIGVNATRLWLELNGVNALSFSQNAFRTREGSLQKSFSKTRSFNHEMTSDKEVLLRRLGDNLDIFFEELYRKRCEIRSITVMLRTKEFHRLYTSYEFRDYTLSRHEIYSVVENLLSEIYHPDTLYRSTGIITYDMRLFTPRQLSLSDVRERQSMQAIKLEKTLSDLRSKYGKQSVRVGVGIL